ncbi:hypothetical protein [Brevundimonas sp.]|uniref:hypothetical protein n=1 Tax=Brevundimonas sp. TaxID=1871086 RepID=UPI003F6E84B8
MSTFSLRLHYASGIGPTDEPLDAIDETEARELARVRLLLTRDYSHVELHHGGRALDVFARD